MTENTVFNDTFIDIPLSIIFEDVDSGKLYNNVEDSINKIFDTLDKTENEEPFNIKLVIPKEEFKEDKVKLKISSGDDSENVKNIKLNIPKNEEFKKSETLTSKENEDENNDDVENVNIKLKKDGTENDNVDIKLKLKDSVLSSDDENNVKIKLRMKDRIDEKLKDINLSIYKNEELKKLLTASSPNQVIINSINILREIKRSVDKIVTVVPDDNILVKTQNAIINLLTKINTDYKLILQDKEKCDELAINVTRFVIDFKLYLTTKFSELKDNVDSNQSKDKNLDKKIEEINEDDIKNR